MKLNKSAIEVLLAKKCWNIQDLTREAHISRRTYYTGMKGGINPKQMGKIAKALQTDVETIISQEQ